MKRIIIPIILSMALFLGACEKDPGQGGSATIEGKVVINEVSPSGNILAEYDGVEERVYIIYGDNEIYDDEVRSSYDGRFKFDDLFKGTYTVFVYSDCSACPSGKETVMQSIEITDRDETVAFDEEFISVKN